MNIIRVKHGLLTLLAAALLGGCGSQSYLINDPTVLLQYRQEPTDASLEMLASSYLARITQSTREGKVPQAGLYAEYAVSMALLGQEEAANEWFKKEIELYPYSADCLRQVRYHLTPRFMADTDTVGYSFLALAEHEDDSADTVAMEESQDSPNNTKVMGEEKVKLSKEDKDRARKEKAKLKKKEQKAKAKAKKQEQKRKAKIKKANQKALAQAKKKKADEKKAKAKAKEAEKKAIKKAKADAKAKAKDNDENR